jgi:DNA-binding transcriptional LysR family regulator
MELSSLRAFVQVAHDNSFSLAAESLFITQPAVSKRIATLETELGSQLFDRVGREIHLTEAGRQLLPRAEQILREMADIRREMSNLSGRVAGTLAMGTSHHIGLHRLPQVLKRFTDEHPQVALDIRFQGSEKVCQAVEQGELELGVVTLPLQPSAHLVLKSLWRDPLRFVVSNDHPLAGRRTVAPDELIRHPAVLPNKATYTRTLLEEAFTPLGKEILCGLSTDYLETLKMMASIGLGWSLLPATMLDTSLRALEIEGIHLERRLGLVTRQQRTLSNAARAMMQLLHEAAAENKT